MTRLAIDIDYCREVLARLLAIPSPTGYTDTIVRAVCAELETLGLGFEITRRGAIRAYL
jgi:putative aminopeptidase FrvX